MLRICCSGRGIAVSVSEKAIAATLLCVLTLAYSHAQKSPTVTEADLRRAAQQQPNVTKADIERAQRTHRMPTDEELSRVPHSTPKIDALPQPVSPATIDLEAIASGYADVAGQNKLPNSTPHLLVFVSFSVPERSLKQIVAQAAKTKATLVLRGLVEGSLPKTVAAAQRLIGNKQVGFQIDPRAFERFGVTSVPTYVVLAPQSEASGSCTQQSCAADVFAAVAGDVTIDYALEQIARRSSRVAPYAHFFARKLKG